MSLFTDHIRWDVVLMLCLFGALLTLEMFGVFRAHFVTITEILCAYIPKWARAMILGWLVYHFLIEH